MRGLVKRATESGAGRGGQPGEGGKHADARDAAAGRCA